MSMESNFTRMKELIALAETDMQKFCTRGNKSAGVRLRKSLQEVKDIACEIRKEVQELRREKV